MSTPVEVEFSVTLPEQRGKPSAFQLLQLRPMVIRREREHLDLGTFETGDLVCRSAQVLGHGHMDDIHDVVVVDDRRFDRSKTVEIAAEIGLFNLELQAASRPYLLIGIGRWGSADPWLGIPVTWDEITGARVIVETDFKDMRVTPSQGTHFFQNLNAFQVGYFTINTNLGEDFLDWSWIAQQPSLKERVFTRHLKFEKPLQVKIDGHSGQGIIAKPR
jgi:hypothetical protein